MTEIDTLGAIEKIKRLKARYFRCLDTRDWAGYGDLFEPDGVLEVESVRKAAGGEAAISRREVGRDQIIAWVSGVLSGATTIHHGHTPEIEIVSADEARAIWAMEDRVIWPERHLHGWGHYHETYRRRDGVWRITASRLTRLRVEITPATGTPDPARAKMVDVADRVA